MMQRPSGAEMRAVLEDGEEVEQTEDKEVLVVVGAGKVTGL
jgi:hypothetical protein